MKIILIPDTVTHSYGAITKVYYGVTILIGAGPAHHGEHLAGAGGSHGHHRLPHPHHPVLGGEPAQSRPVGHRLDVGLVPQSLQDSRVVVAQGDRGDLHEAVEEGVAVHITEVVPVGFVVVSEEGDRGHLLHGVQLSLQRLGPRACRRSDNFSE